MGKKMQEDSCLMHSSKFSMVLSGSLLAMIALSLLALPGYCNSSATKSTKRPAYQQLKPFEDLSLQDDAIEIYDKAVTAFGQQHYDEAEKMFKRVLVLTPKNADAKYNLGAIAEWHGDLHKAMQLYTDALNLKPADRDFLKAVADVKLKMQIDSEAKENKRQENLVEAGQRAKMAFANGDYYVAALELNRLVKSFPNEAKVHYALGQSMRAMKVYEWAAFHLKMAIYLQPTDDTYRKALVELDQELQLAQEQALNDSARIAMVHLHPLSGGELIDAGGNIK